MSKREGLACPCCESARLLAGRVEGADVGALEFRIPDAVFRITLSDRPSVVLTGEAVACLDCGVVLLKTDPGELRRQAERWLRPEAQKGLGL